MVRIDFALISALSDMDARSVHERDSPSAPRPGSRDVSSTIWSYHQSPSNSTLAASR